MSLGCPQCHTFVYVSWCTWVCADGRSHQVPEHMHLGLSRRLSEHFCPCLPPLTNWAVSLPQHSTSLQALRILWLSNSCWSSEHSESSVLWGDNFLYTLFGHLDFLFGRIICCCCGSGRSLKGAIGERLGLQLAAGRRWQRLEALGLGGSS